MYFERTHLAGLDMLTQQVLITLLPQLQAFQPNLSRQCFFGLRLTLKQEKEVS